MIRRLSGLVVVAGFVLSMGWALGVAPRNHPEALQATGQTLVDRTVLPTTTISTMASSNTGDGLTTTTTAEITATAAESTATAAESTTTAAESSTTAAERPPITVTTTVSTTSNPETIPSPNIGSEAGWRFDVSNADTGEDWWRAPYLFDLPYEAGWGWAAGERAGYRCAYGFLVEDAEIRLDSRGRYDLYGGEVYGRVTFTRVDGAEYGKINDHLMLEARRHYVDGSETSAANPVSQGECPEPAVEYEPSSIPDQRWVIPFRSPSGEVVEIRDYRTVVPLVDGLTFERVEAAGHNVTILARVEGDPVFVVYYDGFNGVSVGASLP